eukprot:scaffold101056_cov39-Attheya_sp.AAC.1
MGKEDSGVGCHFGRREFRLRRALCENYATTHSIVQTHPVLPMSRVERTQDIEHREVLGYDVFLSSHTMSP